MKSCGKLLVEKMLRKVDEILKNMNILILEHESGKVRYFGPFFSQEEALKTEKYFCYEKTPYSLAVVKLETPTQEVFLNIKNQDL